MMLPRKTDRSPSYLHIITLNLDIALEMDTHQTLEFHKDGSLISPAILESANLFLSIITQAPETSASWLVNHLVENALQGTSSLGHNLTRIPNRAEVFYISFMHSQDFYVTNCKKNGMDLLAAKNFHFVDCFSELFLKLIPNPSSADGSVDDLFSDIKKKISAVSGPVVVFLEAPEFLLSSTTISTNFLLAQIAKINKVVQEVIVVVNPVPEYQIVDVDDPAFKATDFLNKLYYKSFLNVSLSPLPTGRAKDITGRLAITRGIIQSDVVEREYVYLLSKEGSIRLMYR